MKSDNVTKGTRQAPHRSLFNALGLTKEEMNRPLIGIVSSYNEIVPGHMNLDKITEAVKLGVAMIIRAAAVSRARCPSPGNCRRRSLLYRFISITGREEEA